MIGLTWSGINRPGLPHACFVENASVLFFQNRSGAFPCSSRLFSCVCVFSALFRASEKFWVWFLILQFLCSRLLSCFSVLCNIVFWLLRASRSLIHASALFKTASVLVSAFQNRDQVFAQPGICLIPTRCSRKPRGSVGTTENVAICMACFHLSKDCR